MPIPLLGKQVRQAWSDAVCTHMAVALAWSPRDALEHRRGTSMGWCCGGTGQLLPARPAQRGHPPLWPPPPIVLPCPALPGPVQFYMLWVGVMTAYVFTWIPEWTSWVLICVMALYDIAAVLMPGGPLKVRTRVCVPACRGGQGWGGVQPEACAAVSCSGGPLRQGSSWLHRLLAT